MKRALLVTLLVLSTASIATAADNMWFTSGGAGAPGTALVLTGPGPHLVEVNITFSSPGAGWAMTLFGAAGQSAAGFNYAPGNALGYTADQLDTGAAGSLMSDVGGIDNTGQGGSGVVFTFELSGLGDVTGDFGATAQAYGNGYAWYGFVGPNPISYGIAGYVGPAGTPDQTPGWGSLPVISVIPEPATIALLGLGAVALIRRRR
ncbi:MAG: PEP-CTERM sorting domain-containing protein [Dehalococcoidia bacterium]